VQLSPVSQWDNAVSLYSDAGGISGMMWRVVLPGTAVSIFLVWLFNTSVVARFVPGNQMSFSIRTSPVIAPRRKMLQCC
jgi:hypothetical protein